MWINETRIVITNHAMQRIRERVVNSEDIIQFLLKSKVLILLKNHLGFEIIIPFKGRLVGDFDGEDFIVKSFLLPLRFGKDYYLNRRKSRDRHVVRVSSVTLPKTGHGHCQRKRDYFNKRTLCPKTAFFIFQRGLK
jgi:hypothetical protein